MLKLLSVFVFAAIVAFSTAPASAQYYNRADPGCSVHQGGLCGRDLANWCATWRRTNHGRYAMPAECGGQRYGGPVQRGGSYGGGYVNNVFTRTTVVNINNWHRRVICGPNGCVRIICISGNCPP